MATQQLNPNKKEVSLLQIVEDLNSGLSKWKKDDIGFGSIEKKYNLTIEEAIVLFNHPKIKNKEPRIPTFVIVDDLPDDEEKVVMISTPPREVIETKVVVAPTIVRPSVQIVREEAPKKKAEAFI